MALGHKADTFLQRVELLQEIVRYLLEVIEIGFGFVLLQ
jgi:hypothetical protein